MPFWAPRVRAAPWPQHSQEPAAAQKELVWIQNVPLSRESIIRTSGGSLALPQTNDREAAEVLSGGPATIAQ
jgi:hypothetical protein